MRAAEPDLVAALTSADGPPDPQAPQQQQQQLGDSTVRLASNGAAPGAVAATGDEASSAGHGGHGGVINARQKVPWRAFVRNAPLRALAYTHFCNNWCAGGQAGYGAGGIVAVAAAVAWPGLAAAALAAGMGV